MDIQEIYELYFTAVYRYILALSGNSQIAEDVTQETFFKALKKLDTFRGDCELRVWLCQIAKNEYFQILRKRKKEEFPGEETLQSLPETGSLEQVIVERETYMQVQKILHHMEEPYEVARFAEEQGYYVPGEGTSWELMTTGAGKLGLTSDQGSVTETFITEHLGVGHPLVCSMNPGDFTYTGHFIILSGLDQDGRVIVKDPNSRNNSEKHWDMHILLPQIRAVWVFY